MLFQETKGETITWLRVQVTPNKKEQRILQTLETSTMIPKRYSETYPAIKYSEYFEVGDECREILLRTKIESQE